MFFISLMKKLRKVTDLVDVFEPEDHNDHVDNWKEQLEKNKQWISWYRDIENCVQELEQIINKMRYVKNGDYYSAEDHNLFVSAWEKEIEIDEKIAPNAPVLLKLKQLLSQLPRLAPGDFYFAMYHNIFADAWILQEQINALTKLPPSMNLIFSEDWGE